MMAGQAHYTLPRAEFDRPVKILIVVAPYYRQIADWLIAGAKAEIAAAAALHLVALSRRWSRTGKGVGFTQGLLGGADR